MNKYLRYSGILLVALLALYGTSCKNKKAADDEKYAKGNYFSIYQYAIDAWNNYNGVPFGMVKTVRVNDGKTDTSYTNSEKMNWAPVFLTFFATDISSHKFLDQYKVHSFIDDSDATINLFYKAIDPDMFTQKLLLTFDRDSKLVRGIYIETYEKSVWDETTKKLYYAPYKTIQIQTDDQPLIGKRKHTVEQWDFIR